MLMTRAILIKRALTHIFRLVAHTNQERNESVCIPILGRIPLYSGKKFVQMPTHEQQVRVRCSHLEFRSVLPSSARETMNRYDLGWEGGAGETIIPPPVKWLHFPFSHPSSFGPQYTIYVFQFFMFLTEY